MGGWQADLTSVGPTLGLPAAGVILSSTGGTATLTNNGSIGALSDRAVAGDPQRRSSTTAPSPASCNSPAAITASSTMALFNLRHFADTNGDGVRDTLRVAIADLGTGPNNSFTNNGTLALPAVTGATTLDSTGQYLPLGNPNNAMALGGPLQGHLIGVNDVHQLGHHRSAKQPRRWRRARDHRRAPGWGCRHRHLHLQRRHAEARHGAQRGRRRHALRYIGRRRHVGWRGRRDKHGNPQRRRRGCADRRQRHPGGAGARPDPFGSRRFHARRSCHRRCLTNTRCSTAALAPMQRTETGICARP